MKSAYLSTQSDIEAKQSYRASVHSREWKREKQTNWWWANKKMMYESNKRTGMFIWYTHTVAYESTDNYDESEVCVNLIVE